MEFLSTIKSKTIGSHDQKQYLSRYSSELELVVKHKPTSKRGEHEPTSRRPDAQLVPYRDIFKEGEEQVVRKVLIEGDAGIGKTIFCLSILKDWENEELFQEYKVLLLLSLHEKRIAVTRSLPEFIQVLQGVENLPASIVDNIISGKGVLVVADGWDKLDAPECSESESFLHSLLLGRPLEFASIIVTSRPLYSAWLFENGCFDRLLSIRDFDDGKIKQYIHDFTNNQQEFDNLWKIVDSNSQIKSMCRIPSNCATLCHLWRTPSQEPTTKLCTKILHSIECLPKELKEIMVMVEVANNTKDVSPIQEDLSVVNRGLSPHADAYMQDKLIKEQVTNFLFGICRPSNLELLERAFRSLSKDGHLRYLICTCAFKANDSEITKKAIKALHTPSDSKHFGDPRSTYDCEAILYVIKQVRSIESDAKLELNFQHCNLKKQQLRDLTEILTKEDNKIKIKSFNLSNKKSLPNKEVADLFRKAVTAFQTLEKLSLRNNKIGKKKAEASYTMVALRHLKCLTLLDLSLNPLDISGLKALQHTVKCDCLAQLKILLLQASLTTDVESNLAFLSTALKHCHKLQTLDISRNDFGEPGSPLLCDLIGILFTKHSFNLRMDTKYDTNRLKTMEDFFISQQAEIGHTVVHGIIVGPGRSGKNSLMNRLVGKGPHTTSPSTGVLESVIKVEVKKSCKMDTDTIDLKWTKVKYDEEALELMMITVICHIASLADKGRELEPIPDLITKIDKPTKYESAVIYVENESENKSQNDGENGNEAESESKSGSHQEEGAVPKVARGAIFHSHYESVMPEISYSKEFSSCVGPMNIFKHAIELQHRMHELGEYFESKWSLYLTNTGGQLEFQELMPLLVHGPSVFFVTIPLHINLHKPYTVLYQYPNGKPKKTYLSSFTLMDEILQTLATIAALQYIGPQLEVVDHKPIKPKVFFIGTHKDKLRELVINQHRQDKLQDHNINEKFHDEMKNIDKQLKDKIEQTLLHKQNLIEYVDGTDQLMFTVNNLDEYDCDFQKIRSALERMVDRKESKEFTIPCPCSWLVFSLVLREKYKSSQVLCYYECRTVAQSCGISREDDNDFHKALLFLHHRLGLIRYFPVEGLNDRVIIDPQFMFNTITKLIEETFNDHTSEGDIKDLQTRGIFSKEAMKTIYLEDCSDSQLPFEWTLKLLKHLKIAISFEDQGKEKYFFSSVLCHAPEGTNVSSNYSIRAPPISITFKGGFCPRSIPGRLIKSLMDNDSWKFNQKIFRNEVSFSVWGRVDDHDHEVARIILKILPTHIKVFCFSPETEADHDRSLILRDKFIVTCEKVYKYIKRVMSDITVKFPDSDYYYFAFNCTHSECKEPHLVKINWDSKTLYCRNVKKDYDLPDGYQLWTDSQQVLGNKVLDVDSGGVTRHLGRIADKMEKWKGRIAEELGLTRADIAAINTSYPTNLELQTREALQKWKQTLGSGATYNNLIKVFKQAGYENYAKIVKDLVMKNVQKDTTIGQTPPPHSEQQLPVFPEFKQPPSYATAAGAKVVKEDYELGCDPGSNPRIKVEKSPYDDDRSSQSQSSESDEDSYNMEVEDDKLSEQSETESVTSMQDSTELHRDESVSPMESAQEHWLNSDPAHRNVLKQQSIANDTEAQSESELEKEALSGGNKLSGSMEREVAMLKQGEVEGGTQSDNKPTDSMESDDALLKQSKLQDLAPSDNKQSGSLEREDDSLKLQDRTQLDNKQSSSLESDNDSLKQGILEAGQSIAKKRSRSSLDSVQSKRKKKINPFNEKEKHFIDLTLTTERLVELFASMDGVYVDSVGVYLDTPSSKRVEFKMNYQNPAQRKKAYLDYYVHNHPTASWTTIAGVLRQCGLPQQAAVVENTYIQVSERTRLNFEAAMKDGAVWIRNGSTFFLGPGGSGKTHTLLALLEEDPPAIQESTACAKKPIRAVAQFKLGVRGTTHFIRITDDHYSEMLANSAEQCTVSIDPTAASLPLGTTVPLTLPSSSSLEMPEAPSPETAPQPPKETSVDGSLPVAKLDLKRELQCLMQAKSKTSEQLHNKDLMDIKNLGGLPMIHEVLPVFVTNTMFGILTVKLNKSLDSRPLVHYISGGRVGEPFHLPFTHLETFRHYLRVLQSTCKPCPKIIFVGTHKDLEHECQHEDRKEKNRKLQSIIPPEMKDNIIYNGESLLFAINAKAPGNDDRRMMGDLRLLMIKELQKIPRMKIPLRYFALENAFLRLAKYLRRAILSIDECLKEATAYHFTRESLDDVLQYLHNRNVIMYYKSILPDVVFIDAQVLLDKITELVEYGIELRTKYNRQNVTAYAGSLEKFKTCGIVTAEILSHFSSGYVPGLFEEKHLILLFKWLLVVAEIGNGKYLMPCLLEIEKIKILSNSTIPAFFFYFGRNGPKLGVYCFLLASLITDAKWKLLMEDNSPIQLSRNRAQFAVPGNNPGCITITDSFSTFFQVSIDFPDDISSERALKVCKEVCPLIRETIFSSIRKASNKLNYTDSIPEAAFLCSKHDESTAPHPAIIHWTGLLTCTTHPRSVFSELTDSHRLWLGEETYASDPADARRLTIKNLSQVQRATWDARTKWYNIGLELEIDPETLYTIEEKSNNIDDQFRAMLMTWLNVVDPRPTWEALAEALRSPTVGYEHLAERCIMPPVKNIRESIHSSPSMLSASDRTDAEKLTIKDLRKVQRATWDCRVKWYNIGLELDIDPEILNTIKGNNDNIDYQFRAMLTTWLKMVNPRPTWEVLAEALRSPTVGYEHLTEHF